MELKEFVKTVLTEISAGVADAKKELEGKNVIVNPSIRINDANRGFVDVSAEKPIAEVHFEVALTSSKTKGDTEGIGVFLGSFGVGGKSDTKTNNEEITRIGFSIPLAFPTTKI